MASLERLFHPRGIAIIGASADPVRIGGAPLRALREFGFKGAIYPVNPKYDEIAGVPCYRDVAAIEGPCDLAVVAVSAAATGDVLRACGDKGIPFAVVLSAGYRESGDAGAVAEAALREIVRDGGMRMVGPNCQGLINLPDAVYAAFGAIATEPDLRTGSVSMVFQSGGFGFTIALLCEESGVGFRYLVSSGNETDLTTPEILEAFLDDPGASTAFALIEGVSDGRALQAVGRKGLACGKPVIVWKIGNTETGARAAASHTANMTGQYDIYQAAFRQAGILEACDVEALRDMFAVFGAGRLPAGDGMGVISITGGSGIAFADRAVTGGLRLPALAPATTEALAEVVPAFGSLENPVDVTANLFNNVENFTSAVDVILDDAAVDHLCILMASVSGGTAEAVARAIADAAARGDKPVSVAWSARRRSAVEAYEILESAGIPIIPTPVRAADAAAALWRFARMRAAPREADAPAETAALAVTLPETGGALDEKASKDLLAAFGIPVTRDRVLLSGAAPDLGDLTFPVVAKILSPDIAHKTDVGGVRVGIGSPEELARVAAEIEANARRAMPDARIEGVLVSEMAAGQEALAGVINDPVFGPTVAFGLGGIFAEAIRDVTYRVAPFDAATARAMIAELRAHAVFEGLRGEPLDIDALADTLAAVSRMAWRLRDRLAELDINPLFVGARGQGVKAADALVVLEPDA